MSVDFIQWCIDPAMTLLPGGSGSIVNNLDLPGLLYLLQRRTAMKYTKPADRVFISDIVFIWKLYGAKKLRSLYRRCIMLKALLSLCMITLLTACGSTALIAIQRAIPKSDRMGLGPRAELRFCVEEPDDCDAAPTFDKRAVYGRSGGETAAFDQTVWITATWKF